MQPYQSPQLLKATLQQTYQFLRVLFNVFMSRLLFGGGGSVYTSLLCPFFSTESAVMDTTAKVTSLPCIVIRNTDHRLPWVFWEQNEPRASTGSQASVGAMDLNIWSLVTMQTADINMTLCHSMSQITVVLERTWPIDINRVNRYQYWAQKLTWFSVITQARVNNIVPDCHRTTDPDMILRSSRPWTSKFFFLSFFFSL